MSTRTAVLHNLQTLSSSLFSVRATFPDTNAYESSYAASLASYLVHDKTDNKRLATSCSGKYSVQFFRAKQLLSCKNNLNKSVRLHPFKI